MKTNKAFVGRLYGISPGIVTGALALALSTIPLPAAPGNGGGIGGGVGGGVGGGNGGGHTETVGNNLSFPVIWGDGSMLLQGTMLQVSLAVPWSETVDYDNTQVYAYPQKTVGNVWQAENEVWAGELPLVVDEIDWGDSLESVDMKVGRPVRIELSLYKLFQNEDEYMTGFIMAMLANPSSKDEVQGVIAYDRGSTQSPVYEAIPYQSPEATVYSQNGKLVLQKLEGLREDVQEGDLYWDGAKWVDADPADLISIGPPQSLTFTGELNVGGKVIYGLSQGGWRPTSTGDYRITFFLPLDPAPEQPKVSFDENTIVRESVEEEVTVAAEGDAVGGTGVVVWGDNLSYIDIRVVGGGGGGKKPKSK